MILDSVSPSVELADDDGYSSQLVKQPDKLSLPIRVPVSTAAGGTVQRAEVIGSTAHVLLLQGPEGDAVPPLGTPIRLKVEWDTRTLSGRIAAHGVAGRYLMSIGDRAVRRSRRFPVDVPGLAKSANLHGTAEVRVTDLSTGGARVEGIELPIASEVELQFAPARPATYDGVRFRGASHWRGCAKHRRRVPLTLSTGT